MIDNTARIYTYDKQSGEFIPLCSLDVQDFSLESPITVIENQILLIHDHLLR